MRKMETERLIKNTLKVGNQLKQDGSHTVERQAAEKLPTSAPPKIKSSVHYSQTFQKISTLVCRNHAPSIRLPEHTPNGELLLTCRVVQHSCIRWLKYRANWGPLLAHTHAIPRLRCKLDHFRLLVLQWFWFCPFQSASLHEGSYCIFNLPTLSFIIVLNIQLFLQKSPLSVSNRWHYLLKTFHVIYNTLQHFRITTVVFLRKSKSTILLIAFRNCCRLKSNSRPHLGMVMCLTVWKCYLGQNG